MVVTDEAFGFDIPIEWPSEFHRDPTHNARGIGPMRNRSRSQRCPARLNTLQPVPMMLLAMRELHGYAFRVQQLWVAGVERLKRSRRRVRVTRRRLGVARDEN